MLEKAVQEELIRTNLAVGCKLPPKRGREMQVLGREELQRFLIQAQAEGYFELFLLVLSPGVVEVLRAYRETVDSRYARRSKRTCP